jgi:hypothetical protein
MGMSFVRYAGRPGQARRGILLASGFSVGLSAGTGKRRGVEAAFID